MCSMECADAVYDILKNNHQIKLIGPDSWPYIKLSKKNLKNASCIIFPGGDGNSDQFDNNLYKYKKLIRNYVLKGGKYFGICMGSYFAGEYYFDMLPEFYAEQYIKQKNSDIKSCKANVLKITWKDNKKYNMYFHDGAAFIPKYNFVVKNVYGRYKNKDIAGLTTSFGKGKLALIGPHPEAPRWWFYTQSNIKDYWKKSIQHHLFLEMFNDLIYDKTTRSRTI